MISACPAVLAQVHPDLDVEVLGEKLPKLALFAAQSLRQVVLKPLATYRTPYLNRESEASQKYRHCRCSRNTFYLRLHVAHQSIQSRLMRRAA